MKGMRYEKSWIGSGDDAHREKGCKMHLQPPSTVTTTMLSRTTSTVLSRRTSSLTIRVRGKAPDPQKRLTTTAPRFPPEITEMIIKLVLLSYPCSDFRFSAIISIIHASKALREITLGLYFRDVIIESRTQLFELWESLSVEKEVFGMSGSFAWVKLAFFPPGSYFDAYIDVLIQVAVQFFAYNY